MTSVMADDQEKALRFCTEVLGFAQKTDIPAGGARRLTVASTEQPDGPEVLLVPAGVEPARASQKALFDAVVPLTSVEVAELEVTYQRLRGPGVVFRMPPTRVGPVAIEMFEDACGNLIQLGQR